MNRKFARFRFFWLSTLVSLLAIAPWPAEPSIAKTIEISKVTGSPRLQTTVPSGRIVVRFAPEAGTTPAGGNSGHRKGSGEERIASVVARWTGGSELKPRFPGRGTVGSGQKLIGAPELALYAHFDAGTSNRDRLMQMVRDLQADPAVDLAWIEPVAVPASLGFLARPGGQVVFSDRAESSFLQAKAPSGDFTGNQGYLGDAPSGIGALSMRGQPGALGGGLTAIDVEGAWLWAHEDLPAPVADIGIHIPDLSWRNHGTAVLGVVRGIDNAFGVTGITPACAVGASSIGSQSPAEAILAAADQLSPGNAIIIELHAPGPESDGEGQNGYVPMEFWQDNFDAIRLVTSLGIIVCEAAGNGAVDLDAPIYQGLFDPAVRNSGAIMVGATNGSTTAPAWFSNHGQRLDLSGWGFNVTTAAYGGLQGEPDWPESQWYTASFSGTSSATPIVTGAVLGLQGMVRAAIGLDLDARLARDILSQTGTPISGPQMVGPRPDLVAAFALAQAGIGEVTGTVTDAVTGLSIGGITVQVTGGGAQALTVADGTWRIPLLVGPVDLEFGSFTYETEIASTVITSGGSHVVDVAMTAWPQVEIQGVVQGGGAPLSGAMIVPQVHPIPPAVSQPDGSFQITGVPIGQTYSLLVDGVPGFGARYLEISTAGAVGAVAANPQLASISEDFELGDGGFSSTDTLWTHGTPPAGITGPAFSGTKCWGIGMDGQGYGADQADTLRSVVYDLTGIVGDRYYLSFHYYGATEVGYDGVNLSASDGGPFTLLDPAEGYPDLFLGGLGNAGGWSGNSGRWQGTVFDITDYLGGSFQFQLAFGSDGGLEVDGFYVDGVTFGQGLAASAVENELLPGLGALSLRAWPNPFNPVVTIEYELPVAGEFQAEIYDLRGRRVRRLHDGPMSAGTGRLTWNGTDASGRSAASGVYLIRLRDQAGHAASRRVVLAK